MWIQLPRSAASHHVNIIVLVQQVSISASDSGGVLLIIPLKIIYPDTGGTHQFPALSLFMFLQVTPGLLFVFLFPP